MAGALALLSTGNAGEARAAVGEIERRADLPYADGGNPRQALDLYLPKNRASAERLPVVVFIHGGGWIGGSRASGQEVLRRYVASGHYAGVSVGYRLAGEAAWPAQIHDCKAAIRWIRAQAASLGLDGDRIGVIGSSAGGTLATLLGTSGGVADLEGTVGPHRAESSRVQAVHNRFGRINFLAEPESARSAPAQAAALASRLRMLFGGSLEEKAAVARQASPLAHLTPDDPPILTTHGDADATVPLVQAQELDEKLRAAGLRHLFIVMRGYGHGFQDAEEARRAELFFDRYLRGRAGEISTEPIVASRRRRTP